MTIGILSKATTAKVETTKEQAYEEIKLVLNEWRITNATTNKTLEQFLDEKMESNEIDSYEMLDDGNIEIYRNGYMVEVDKKGNIVSEVQKSGPRPTVTDISIKLQDGTEVEDFSQEIGTPLVIDFKASIEGGEIISIEPNKPYTTNGNEQTITFTITGKINEDEYTRKVKISVNDKYLKTYETMERVANELTNDGYKKVQISANGEDILHKINAIVYNNDLRLDGRTNVKGATLKDNIYEFGDSTKDVATETEDAQNTVMLKVNGNITINEGVTLTTCKSEEGYGGPKGLIIYCTGTIINDGEISMTARGAKAEGQNIYLLKNADNSYEFIPKNGEAGGESVSASAKKGGTTSTNGIKGKDGELRATAGGGSGGAFADGAIHCRPNGDFVYYDAFSTSGAGARRIFIFWRYWRW